MSAPSLLLGVTKKDDIPIVLHRKDLVVVIISFIAPPQIKDVAKHQWTIALSLSATAYDTRPQRRDAGTAVPGNGVGALGTSSHDLSMLSTSNTSDAHSLNMNRKRALDDRRLVRRSPMHNVPMTLVQGRFTGTVDFDGKSESLVVFDTGSSTTWAKSSDSSSSDTNTRPFTSVGVFKFMGHTAKGVVTVDGVSSSEMEYKKVPGKTPNGYRGGLALDRSDKSWLESSKIDSVFAFYSTGHVKGEFHLGGLDMQMSNHLDWYEAHAGKNTWTFKDTANLKVGEQVKGNGISAVIDTGVWYVYGPAEDVAKLYKPSKGVLYSGKTGSWEIPCHTPMKVSFSWGQKDYPINDFMLKLKDGKTCLGIIRQRKDLSDGNWVLGVPFLHGKYVAFNKLKGKIGLSVLYDASKL